MWRPPLQPQESKVSRALLPLFVSLSRRPALRLATNTGRALAAAPVVVNVGNVAHIPALAAGVAALPMLMASTGGGGGGGSGDGGGSGGGGGKKKAAAAAEDDLKGPKREGSPPWTQFLALLVRAAMDPKLDSSPDRVVEFEITADRVDW